MNTFLKLRDQIATRSLRTKLKFCLLPNTPQIQRKCSLGLLGTKHTPNTRRASMEEAMLVQSATTQISNPPSSVEAPPSLPPKTKKRPLDSDAHISNSTSFKIRAVLREIRPHVLEVLRTPDFQKCKAANEIQEQVKLLMDLYKQMTAETLSAPRCNDVPEGQLLSGANPQDTRVFARPSEHKFPSGISDEKQQAEDGQIKGAYVVGGSAFGWNFITFSSMEPVYYGMTKESFRAQAAKLTTV